MFPLSVLIYIALKVGSYNQIEEFFCLSTAFGLSFSVFSGTIDQLIKALVSLLLYLCFDASLLSGSWRLYLIRVGGLVFPMPRKTSVGT